jgi:uncharacterized membrane-anchored protein YitT (DUF2179 family)
MNRKIRNTIFQYLQAIIGTLIGAFAVAAFLSPFNIAPGGVTGISVILNSVLGFPIGFMVFLFNIPILIMSAYMLPGGWRAAFSTIFVVVIYSVAIEIFKASLAGYVLSNDRLLNALFGGVLAGLSGGFVYRSGMSLGGTSTIALIVQRRTGMSMSSIFLYTDALIILLAGWVFGLEGALYALVVLFISGIATDYVMEGPSVIRTVVIITDQGETISYAILEGLQRGVTLLPAKGMYTGQDRSMLYITIARSQVNEMRQLVQNIDPHAFIVIGIGHSAYGHGFKETRPALPE